MFAIIFLPLLLLFAKCAENSKILGVFPVPSPSHYSLGNALMKGLAEKGHDVTIISPFHENNPPSTYHEIFLPELREEVEKHQLNMFEAESVNPLVFFPIVTSMVKRISEVALGTGKMRQLLASDEKFDLVIVEDFYIEPLKAFANHFNAHLVTFSSQGSSFWSNPLVGNPAPPSYVPDNFQQYSSKMNFWERTINTIMYLEQEAWYKFYLYPYYNGIIKKYFPNPPELSQITHNTSLVLLNSFPGLSQPVPHVPNMIEIGGFHIKPPEKLPHDLQQFLDEAQNGVVYFSMGSNLRSSDLPKEKLKVFLEAFSELPQKILWKWEEDSLPGQPSNVKLSKWLPQPAVLAHPNVKLFITHGGWLSTTETIYFGVPILAIPVFGDQKMNAQKAVDGGFALTIPFQELEKGLLSKNLKELLGNEKYRQEAKKRSSLFHDRLKSPMETAVYWVEYVIRQGGAPNLRVAGVDLPWYKYHLVDVILFGGIVTLVLVALLKTIFAKFVKAVKIKSD